MTKKAIKKDFDGARAIAYAQEPRRTLVLLGAFEAVGHLATCPPALAQAARADAVPVPVPSFRNQDGVWYYMPGSGVRSKLRGALTAVMRDASKARGELLSLHSAQYNRLGGVKQSGDETEPSAEALADIRARNPAVSLFGASTPWIDGLVMVSDMRAASPNIELVTFETVRASTLRRDPSMIEFLDAAAVSDIQAAQAAVADSVAAKAAIKKLKSELRAATAERQAEIRSTIATLEGSKVVSEQNLQPGYRAIPSGTRLSHRIELRKVTEIEIGAFVGAAVRFAKEPLLGGHLAHGAGRIAGTWTVMDADGQGTVVGSIEIADFGICRVTGDALIAAQQRFEAFLASDQFSMQAPTAAASAQE